MKKILMFATVVLLLALGAGTALAQSGYDLFQKALVKERAVGDVEEALRLYQRIVKEFGGNHALAAKAELRMGLLYDRLGRKADAQRAYQAVVNQYADQTNEARQARAKIVTAVAPRNTNATAKRVTGESTRQMTMIWSVKMLEGLDAVGLSADGRYLSFTTHDVGDLAVRDLREGTNRRLTNNRDWIEAWAETSVISPDGRQVAYAWFDRKLDAPPESRPGCCLYDLRILPVSGGEAGKPQIVYRSDETRYIQVFGWTPDGKSLLIVRQLQDSTYQIAAISIADGSVRVLKSLEWRHPRKISLSPDGRYIAYDAPAGADVRERDIFLLSADGSRETVVVENPANDDQPVWSPDGSQILFVSNRTGKNSLWTVHIDAGRPSGSAELVKPDIDRLLGMTRTSALYFASGGPTRNIYTVDMDANGKVKTAPSLATDRFVNSNGSPSWSPDGQYLAYYSLHAGSIVLVIRSLKTGEERDVPSSGLFLGNRVRWFPDGRSVLVVSYDRQQNRVGFYRLDIASGNAELLFYAPSVRDFDLSADGKSIYYGVGKLMRFDMDSRRETEVKEAPDHYYFASMAVSPDGAQLAYFLKADALGFAVRLEVMPVGGGEPREVVHSLVGVEHAPHIQLAWTPDQRYLLFTSRGPGGGPGKLVEGLWRVPVTGGAPENTCISVKGHIWIPGMSPDGHRLTFGSVEDGAYELWALDNFLPAAQTRKTTASRR